MPVTRSAGKSANNKFRISIKPGPKPKQRPVQTKIKVKQAAKGRLRRTNRDESEDDGEFIRKTEADEEKEGGHFCPLKRTSTNWNAPGSRFTCNAHGTAARHVPGCRTTGIRERCPFSAPLGTRKEVLTGLKKKYYRAGMRDLKTWYQTRIENAFVPRWQLHENEENVKKAKQNNEANRKRNLQDKHLENTLLDTDEYEESDEEFEMI